MEIFGEYVPNNIWIVKNRSREYRIDRLSDTEINLGKINWENITSLVYLFSENPNIKSFNKIDSIPFNYKTNIIIVPGYDIFFTTINNEEKVKIIKLII